jgi:hypothetical protein
MAMGISILRIASGQSARLDPLGLLEKWGRRGQLDPLGLLDLRASAVKKAHRGQEVSKAREVNRAPLGLPAMTVSAARLGQPGQKGIKAKRAMKAHRGHKGLRGQKVIRGQKALLALLETAPVIRTIEGNSQKALP